MAEHHTPAATPAMSLPPPRLILDQTGDQIILDDLDDDDDDDEPMIVRVESAREQEEARAAKAQREISRLQREQLQRKFDQANHRKAQVQSCRIDQTSHRKA